MIRVKLWGSLKDFAGGNDVVEIEASNFKQLTDELRAQYPTLEPQIERGVSMALDGVIYRESWFTPIPQGSEVFLLPYMEGG